MRVAIQVVLDVPERVSKTRVRDYVRQAVMEWAGSLDPEDGMRDLDRKTVTVGAVLVMRP